MDKVVKLADHTFKLRRHSYLEKDLCKHLTPVLDENGQTVHCEDCGKNIDPYWMLGEILRDLDREQRDMEHKRLDLEDASKQQFTRKAAMAVDKAWRSRNLVPACPHCHRGILESDRFGQSMIHKDMEMRRREIERNKP